VRPSQSSRKRAWLATKQLCYWIAHGRWGAIKKLFPIQAIRNFFHTLTPLKIEACLCIAFALFVTIPDQSLELYRYIAQSLATSQSSGYSVEPQGLIDSVILILSTCLLSTVLLAAAAFQYSLHYRADEDGVSTRFSTTTFMLIGVVPSFAVGTGLLRATIDVQSPQLRNAVLAGLQTSFERDHPAEVAKQVAAFELSSQLEVNQWLYLGASVLLLLSATFWLASRSLFKCSPRMRADTLIAGSRSVIASGFSLPVVLSILFWAFPVLAARAITAFGIICLFFVVMALFMAALSLLTARTEIPLLFLIILFASTFNLLGLNDNHKVRELARQDSAVTRPPPAALSDGFIAWLNDRQDLARYDTYPVYVVTAEGGGIYAAYRTAAFLASLQDLCPRFSHHLFAISSVSGGSIGAAVFTGLVQKIKQDRERFEAGAGCANKVHGLLFTDVAEDILRDDFLSPVTAAFLFPDFLQRFLFFRIPQFDRAISLESSFETSWDQKTKRYYNLFPDRWVDHDNALRGSFAKSWNPASDTPALFINATEVESGRGRVISPLAVTADEFSTLPLLPDSSAKFDGLDIFLSTAAVLSARFPWLTPAGSVSVPTGGADQPSSESAPALQTIQLVDGGYLDNSGITTALAVVREMRSALTKAQLTKANAPKVRITLIVLTSQDFSNPEILPGDYLSPFQTLLNTRVARGLIAIKQAERFFNENAAPGSSANTADSLEKVVMYGYGYPLPLGWRLSPITRLLILGQIGDPFLCKSAPVSQNCLKARVYDEMSR
jgi:hypothetical protein